MRALPFSLALAASLFLTHGAEWKLLEPRRREIHEEFDPAVASNPSTHREGPREEGARCKGELFVEPRHKAAAERCKRLYLWGIQVSES